MELTEFKARLYAALIERGIPEEAAGIGVAGVTKDINDEKRRLIERLKSPDELNHFADVLASKISASPEFAAVTASLRKADIGSLDSSDDIKTLNFTSVSGKSGEADEADIEDYATAPIPTSKQTRTGSRVKIEKRPGGNGDKVFLALMIGTSPLILAAIILLGALFALCYVGVAALIATAIALLTAIVVAGVVLVLVGLIYGVIMLFSVPLEGIYEIGLAAVFAGSTMILAILLYNAAIRYLPKLFPPIMHLIKYTVSKITAFYYYIKKECYEK